MTSRFPTAEERLSFPTPNYVDPVTRRPLAVGIIAPITVLVVVFISCRFYSRTILTKTLGWDDGIMLLAAVRLDIILAIGQLAERTDHRCCQYPCRHNTKWATISVRSDLTRQYRY